VHTGAQLVNDGVVIHMSKEQREAVLEAQLDWVR
jgi:hypothetical protein